MIGRRLWSICEVGKLIFEYGKGIIDCDGGTMAFNWASIVDRVIDLL